MENYCSIQNVVKKVCFVNTFPTSTGDTSIPGGGKTIPFNDIHSGPIQHHSFMPKIPWSILVPMLFLYYGAENQLFCRIKLDINTFYWGRLAKAALHSTLTNILGGNPKN